MRYDAEGKKVGGMQKLYRYQVSCVHFLGLVSLRIDNRVQEHARQKIAEMRGKILHDKRCPEKEKSHAIHVQFLNEEMIH